MSPRPQDEPAAPVRSRETLRQQIAVKQQPDLFTPYPDIPPGSMNDAALVRQVLTESMRLSNKSRAQIADEMTYLCGRPITERMLNAFTAESREDHRFPSELERAFCKATGADRLLKVLSLIHI